MKQVFFGLLLISFLPACSEPSNQEKSIASCYVRYLAPEGQSLAEFRLRTEKSDNPTPQPVEVPDGVSYQDVLMSMVTSQGISYRLEQSNGYALEHRFAWKDAKSQPQRFTMNMQAITSFSFQAPLLSNKAPATLRWEGAALEKGESLVLIWEQADGGLTVPMEIIGSPGQSQIDFPAAQMAKLPTGRWALYLVRKKRVKEEVAGTVVFGAMEYYTQVDTVVIE